MDGLDIAKQGMRLVRDEALQKTDWMVMVDSPLDDAEKQIGLAYRAYLRDLPEQMTDEDFMTFAGVKTFEEFKTEAAAE